MKAVSNDKAFVEWEEKPTRGWVFLFTARDLFLAKLRWNADRQKKNEIK